MLRRGLLLAPICAASLLAPRVAGACGASPPTEWRLQAVVPAAGGTIPTDGAIVIRRQALAPVGLGSPDAATVVVTVRDATNVPIPGDVSPWFDAGSSLVWTPKAPLPADATLAVEATVGAPSSAPAATDGTKVTALLQVGAGPAPALHVAGDLEIAYEAYDATTPTDCPSSCSSCPAGPPVRALRARVTLPPVTGGFAPVDYLAWLWLTDDVPHVLPDGPSTGNVALGGVERLGDGTRPTVAFRPIAKEAQDYAPCFSVRVVDPAGHFDDLTHCMPKVNVDATLAALDQPAPGATAGTTSAAGSGGCAVGGPGVPGAASVFVLALLAARASRRPRRARSVIKACPCRSARSPSEA
jgi:hypothetical protein